MPNGTNNLKMTSGLKVKQCVTIPFKQQDENNLGRFEVYIKCLHCNCDEVQELSMVNTFSNCQVLFTVGHTKHTPEVSKRQSSSC